MRITDRPKLAWLAYHGADVVLVVLLAFVFVACDAGWIP